MKSKMLCIGLALFGVSGFCSAQTQTLGNTMEVLVFPADGQAPSQQSKDEAECYQWANTNTGVDPFALTDKEKSNQELAQAEQQAAKNVGAGAGAGGAIKGAAVGALVGEIGSGDASNGAAWGAAVGAVSARRHAKAAQNQAQQQAAVAQEQRSEDIEGQRTNFKKAFSLCLEAKKYMVKY
jgi:hypothetical protein